jgi:hypothetical protein
MNALAHFRDAWGRADHLSTIHAYLEGRLTAAMRADELLRAEWVARISALDLYVHELVAQGMLESFTGSRPQTQAYLRFQVSTETLLRVRAASGPVEQFAAMELEVRTRLGRETFQDPERIADGVRLISAVELWNEVALALGANAATKVAQAKAIKRGLSLLVDRRNKIAHEGDLQPGVTRTPWPIARADLRQVETTLRSIVEAIDRICA